MLVVLLQIKPEVVGFSMWRFYRDGLIQAEREILREVEMQFFYTRDLGMRPAMNTVQCVRANAYSDWFTPGSKSCSVQDEIETTLCRRYRQLCGVTRLALASDKRKRVAIVVRRKPFGSRETTLGEKAGRRAGILTG